MKITVSIMAHPKRKHAAEALYKKLIQYPFSGVFIIWDEINNEWHTGRRALHGGEVLDSDWHMVLQDDALLTPDFYDNIVGAIEHLPTKGLFSLYVGRVKPISRRVVEAVEKATHATWLSHYMLLWGVGIVLPSDHVAPMLDFLDDPKYRDTPYDTRVGMFYLANRLPIYYTMPSLVDHDDSIDSLLADHQTLEPRIAHRLANGPVRWNSEIINI